MCNIRMQFQLDVVLFPCTHAYTSILHACWFHTNGLSDLIRNYLWKFFFFIITRLFRTDRSTYCGLWALRQTHSFHTNALPIGSPLGRSSHQGYTNYEKCPRAEYIDMRNTLRYLFFSKCDCICERFPFETVWSVYDDQVIFRRHVDMKNESNRREYFVRYYRFPIRFDVSCRYNVFAIWTERQCYR